MECRRMKNLPALLLLLPIVSACASGPGKAELDEEVKRLCAIDGGVKVYETVRLPAEKFNQWGQVRIPAKQNAKPSDEYYYVWGVIYMKTGKPEEGIPDLARSHFSLHRTSDKKLLAGC
jgi:hypothetical protein